MAFSDSHLKSGVDRIGVIREKQLGFSLSYKRPWRNIPVGLARCHETFSTRLSLLHLSFILSIRFGRFQLSNEIVTNIKGLPKLDSRAAHQCGWFSILRRVELLAQPTEMAGKLFNVFVIVLLLGIFALATEASTGGKPLKKKSVPEKTGNKYSFSDDDELMFADQSGDGPDDNESIDELDPDFSVDGLPDLNELLPEGEIDAVIPTRRPAYRPPATVKPPCGQAGKPCQSANRPPCQAGRPCQNANPPQSANPPKPCQSAGRPCSQAKPQPCQSGRPCTQAKPTPCKTSKPCPSVKPPPCQTGRRCQTARRPCYSKRTCQTKRPCQTKRLCQSPAPIIPPAFSPTVV